MVIVMKVYKNLKLNGKSTDITVDNGKIISIEPTEKDGIDFGGKQVRPGMIDIHIHGCAGFDATDNPDKLQEMSDYLARKGTTTWYPTTLTYDFDKLKEAVSVKIDDIPGANIPGFHMEGPYISENKLGVMNAAYLRKPNADEVKDLIQVKLINIAPELEGAMEFIEQVDMVVSLGHSVADYDTAVKAANKGAKCLTHTFNAMPPMLHRDPSLIGAALTTGMYAQVISDGVHIHPAVVLALYKMFGSDKMVLISDCISVTGLTDNGELMFGGKKAYVKDGICRNEEGALNGGTTDLFKCVKKAIEFGIPEDDAFKMASETPAKLMGLNKGIIAPGYDADFIVIDDQMNISDVIISGEIYN